MPPLKVDRRPLYIQAQTWLLDRISSGEYRPGQQLPSEDELANELGISRATLREAMRMLEESGSIVRRHGVGTFVAQACPVIESGLELLESIEALASRIGLETRMEEARIEERPARPAEVAGLKLDGSARVLSADRVIVAGEQPVAHLLDVVPVEYLRQGDLGEGFNGSVLEVLLRRSQPPLAYSRTDLSAQAADTVLARQLRVARRAPLLRLEAQLHAQDGRVVDYSISHFVPGYFRFHVVRRVA